MKEGGVGTGMRMEINERERRGGEEGGRELKRAGNPRGEEKREGHTRKTRKQSNLDPPRRVPSAPSSPDPFLCLPSACPRLPSPSSIRLDSNRHRHPPFFPIHLLLPLPRLGRHLPLRLRHPSPIQVQELAALDRRRGRLIPERCCASRAEEEVLGFKEAVFAAGERAERGEGEERSGDGKV